MEVRGLPVQLETLHQRMGAEADRGDVIDARQGA